MAATFAWESRALWELLAALGAVDHGEDWPAVAEALRPVAERLCCRPRSADELKSMLQAVRARGPAGAPLNATVAALRAERAAELRTELSALEAQATRLRRDVAAVDGGERDDIATLLAMLPPGVPLLVPPAGAGGASLPSKAATAQLLKMLNAIAKHKWAYPFKRPVTDKEAPDYKDIIKQPMDFSTIRKRIECGQVSSLSELRADLSLVFSNAMLYNAKGSDYYKMAESLQSHARQEVERLLAETANASHLSPEASELLRGAGVNPSELSMSKSTSTRLRSSQPPDGGPAATAAGGGEGEGEAGAEEEAGGGAGSLEQAFDGASPLGLGPAGGDAESERAGLQPKVAETPAQPAVLSGRKRDRGSAEGSAARARSRR